MLTKKVFTLQITSGPSRPDLAMAWSLAGSPEHKDARIVNFTSSDGKKRSAIIRELAYAAPANDRTVKIAGGIAWHNSEVHPEILAEAASDPTIDPEIMAAFSGTYDTHCRSGQFEVEYYEDTDQN